MAQQAAQRRDRDGPGGYRAVCEDCLWRGPVADSQKAAEESTGDHTPERPRLTRAADLAEAAARGRDDDRAGEVTVAALALGRIFRMAARPAQPGDVEEYERCRAIIMAERATARA